MKRLSWIFCIMFFASQMSIQAADIWVSTRGNDRNDGSVNNPKLSLHSALRQARELRRICDPSISNGINIIMKGGTYSLVETLLIRPEDSGTTESPTIIQAAKGESPVISGGVIVKGWRKLSEPLKGLPKKSVNRIMVADLPKFSGQEFDFRQVWVNGLKAYPASDTNDENMMRILSVDKTSKTIRVPVNGIKKFVKPSELEFFIHQMWETAVLRVKDVEIHGNEATLRFYEPESTLEFEHPWPPPVISDNGNSVFRLSRAIEFLDETGEWYHDKTNGKLYYFPRENEDLSKSEVVVPVLETLVNIQGSKENPVMEIIWKGITFSHSGWVRPSQKGYVPLQAGMYILDAYKLLVPGTQDKAALENQAWIGRQPASVQLSNVRNTTFKGCAFKHCGAAGLDYLQGSLNDRVEDCTFSDIAGSGLVAGKFSDSEVETHLPYNPQDSRELCQNMIIRNNLIFNIANEYWGCVGIIAGYVNDFIIEHNELHELAYSGISVGWGWTKSVTCMKNNKIHANLVHHFGKHNYSCGGIYTLSAQPGTLISENCIRDIYKPAYVHDDTGFYIYLDEASSYMTVKDNWCSEIKFGMNQNGMNTFQNNGPQVSSIIKDNAGLNNYNKVK